MNEEYCVIYGGSDENPGPFVIAVSKDQEMINGFREEHYHFCKNGEIINDGQYENFMYDYEISYKLGHYITPAMLTEFTSYLTSIYNRIYQISDTYERELCHLLFNEADQLIVDDGFGLLAEHLADMVPIELSDEVDDSLYGSVLNIEKCLDQFMSTYKPSTIY